MYSALLIFGSLLCYIEPTTDPLNIWGTVKACDLCWLFDKPVEKQRPIPQKKEVKARKFRALYFTADWCGPCRGIHSKFEWLKNSGWTIGDSPDNHIQVVDIDEHPELWSKYAPDDNSVPWVVAIDENRSIASLRPVNAVDLVNLYLNYMNHGSTNPP